MKVFLDGNAWCAVHDDFINIQESDCAFGDTISGALSRLVGDDGFVDSGDGFFWDAKTGEVICGPEPEDEFRVRDEASLEWVLAKMQSADAQVAAVENDPRVLEAKAILANASTMVKDRQSRAEWYRARFEGEILDYALHATEGLKTRTLKTIYGAVSIRKVPIAVKVKDSEEALRIAKMIYPEAVKVTESFLISKLSKEEKEDMIFGLSGAWTEDDEVRKAFELSPERDSLTIKTGVVS